MGHNCECEECLLHQHLVKAVLEAGQKIDYRTGRRLPLDEGEKPSWPLLDRWREVHAIAEKLNDNPPVR